MKDSIQISDDVTVAGQVTGEQLTEAARAGYKSVLNLRAPDEEGVLADEQQRAEAAGLRYVNLPVRKEEISDDLATRVLAQMDELPKPTLVHCASGMRAGAMAFMHHATRHGMDAQSAMDAAQSQGFDCNSEPQLKQFFEHYIGAHGGGPRQDS